MTSLDWLIIIVIVVLVVVAIFNPRGSRTALAGAALALAGMLAGKKLFEGPSDDDVEPGEPSETKPDTDTKTEELDDDAAAEAATNTPPPLEPGDFPDDDPDAVDELGKWSDRL